MPRAAQGAGPQQPHLLLLLRVLPARGAAAGGAVGEGREGSV